MSIRYHSEEERLKGEEAYRKRENARKARDTKENVYVETFAFLEGADEDIVSFLSLVPNKTDYLRKAFRDEVYQGEFLSVPRKKNYRVTVHFRKGQDDDIESLLKETRNKLAFAREKIRAERKKAQEGLVVNPREGKREERKELVVLFDQDGTLTDSGPGILRCADETLKEFGIDVKPKERLRVFVGPPLRDSFRRFGVPSEKIEEAVARYRAKFQVKGKYENTPYPDIEELLSDLKKRGIRLFVATSKPTSIAVDVLKQNGLFPYFEGVYGASLSGDHDTKPLIVQDALKALGPDVKALLVGDTAFDVVGAKENQIGSVAVAWGYGSKESLEEAKPDYLVSTMDELHALLLRKQEEIEH